ncbi:hypothetical protein AVEN_253571-1 [Araneus ventricosus]|uniref:Spaetzle domain-containing protein n=1 Tax=Araneus ventricosus TaxID=182803 RepID=A0A4Y2A5V1_ARAVE|nr:hypothetical protein AVEN_253571-1 [Araneus ventricosus]
MLICSRNPDEPCPYLSDSGILPMEYTTTCRQKFTFKRLLALNPNGTYTYVDNFRFPSCCQCYVKKEFLKLKSFGRGPTFKSRSETLEQAY